MLNGILYPSYIFKILITCALPNRYMMFICMQAYMHVKTSVYIHATAYITHVLVREQYLRPDSPLPCTF